MQIIPINDKIIDAILISSASITSGSDLTFYGTFHHQNDLIIIFHKN